MAFNPEIRASDADRDKVAAGLREHMAQGRLTVDELQERLDGVYAAKTVGDLQRLTADLPDPDLYQLPIPASRRSSSVGLPALHPRGDVYRKGLAAVWGSWASVSLICTVIWLLSVVGSGHWVYPWPLWVAGPWGAVILAGTIFGPKPRDGGGH
jgi:Domain of unknown function (DUF1707)